MKRHLLHTMILLLFVNCTRSHMPASSVISGLSLSAHTITADGTSTITLALTLNASADTSRQTVLFTASGGSFVNGTDSTIAQKAVYINSQLVAQVTYLAPLAPGVIYITAQPDLSSYSGIIVTDSVTAVYSVPATLKISESSFGVPYGFTGEDTITATLSNTAGNPVSLGSKVVFEDYYASTLLGLNGRYRMTGAGTDSASRVSTIYSPGFVAPAGTNFYIKATALDTLGVKTAIMDSVLLTIIQ